jgi:predicted aspartyl protease
MVILLFVAQAAMAAPSVQEILARNKQASGGAAMDSIRTIRTKGTAETSGLKGTTDSITDAKLGYFVDSYDLGAFKGANGFDDTTVWETDASGLPIIQGSADSRQGAVNEAYRRSQSYLYADRMKADLSPLGEKSEGGRHFVGVRAVPQGGRPFDMWFDATTFLMDHVSERNAQELRTTYLSDYRTVKGAVFAFETRQTNGQPKYDSITQTTSVSFEPALDKKAYGPPPPPKRDVTIAGGANSTVIPFRLINNHIYLDVRLNGRPYLFLFDTGGLNVITPSVAAELGLKTDGAMQARGSGEKSQDAGFTKVARLDVGNATLNDQTFVVIGLESFSAVEGMPITGIIGYEVFKRFVVVTDYAASKVVLIEPDRFAYNGRGTMVPIRFNDRAPEIDGDIDGLKGAFTLDTGARDSLTLSTPFVEKNGLVARYNARLSAVTGWGVGGPARGLVVRAKRLSLGSVPVDEPVVELSTNKSGAMADGYLAGNIGAGVLKRFNIVWDYGHNRIWLERNQLDRVRDAWERGGFWINAGDKAFDVIDVTAGGPADKAGLKAGDRIVKINGLQAISQLSLPDARLLILGATGTVLTLDILRSGKSMTIAVTLADLV